MRMGFCRYYERLDKIAYTVFGMQFKTDEFAYSGHPGRETRVHMAGHHSKSSLAVRNLKSA